MLPPHPAAMAISQLLGADVGKVIVCGLIVGLPTAIVAGPMWVKLVCKRHEPASGQSFAVAPASLAPTRAMPGLGLTLLVILLPLLLMVGKTLVTMSLPQGSGFYQLMSFLGNPLTALAIAVVFAYGSLGLYRGLGMVLPLLDAMPGQNREIVVIAIGAGAIGWTTVTDSAFWVVKEYLGVSLGEALKKFTVGTLLASVVALGMTLLVSQWV